MKRHNTFFTVVSLSSLLAIIVAAAVSFSGLRTKIADAELVRDELAAEAQSLAVSNAVLEYEIAHSTDLDMVEKVAREKLGLVLPGEIVFYDIGD